MVIPSFRPARAANDPCASPTQTGTAGNDVLNGTARGDIIAGLGGNDVINGLGGNDVLCGGPGDDLIDGGDGGDVIDGGDGNDTAYGRAGRDVVSGGAGSDTLDGGADEDSLDGGPGNDTVQGGDGSDVVAGGADADTIDGGAGTDTCSDVIAADTSVNCESAPPPTTTVPPTTVPQTTTTTTTSPPAVRDRLASGQQLTPNQRLTSASGQYSLVMQGDSNLVLYAPGGRVLWASNTVGAGATNFTMQTDGNAVLYASGRALWASGTDGNPGAFIVVQDDGNLVVYRPDGRAVYSSNTVQGGGAAGTLGVAFTENPYRCDGGSRYFGSISGAASGERIDFSSPGLSLLSGTASSSGALTIRWQCNPGEAGRSWAITARGASSGRSVSFFVTGAAASGGGGGGGGSGGVTTTVPSPLGPCDRRFAPTVWLSFSAFSDARTGDRTIINLSMTWTADQIASLTGCNNASAIELPVFFARDGYTIPANASRAVFSTNLPGGYEDWVDTGDTYNYEWSFGVVDAAALRPGVTYWAKFDVPGYFTRTNPTPPLAPSLFGMLAQRAHRSGPCNTSNATFCVFSDDHGLAQDSFKLFSQVGAKYFVTYSSR